MKKPPKPPIDQFDPVAKALIRDSLHGILVFDLKGYILTSNTKAAVGFGFPDTEAINTKSMYSFLPEYAAEHLRREVHALEPESDPAEFELDADDKIFLCILTPLPGIWGGTTRYLLQAQDVTEQKRYDQDIRREQQRQIYYMESLPGFVLLIDQGHNVRYANRYARKTFGKVKNKRCCELIYGSDTPCTACPPFDVFETPSPVAWELETQDERTFQCWAYPMTDVDGAPTAMVLGIDITSRIVIEKALKQAERRQKAILDTIPDMVWLKDKDLSYIAVNQAFADTCGKNRQDLIGKTSEHAWDKDLAAGYESRDRGAIRMAKPLVTEEIFIDKDGEYHWMETVRTPFFRESGELEGITGIARDITQRKRVVDRLLYSRHELERRVKERTKELETANLSLRHAIEEHKRTEKRLETAKQKALVAANAKSTFLANMSHEIRTPLNVIMGGVGLALHEAESESLRKRLKMIRTAGDNLLIVINDILDVSKIEAGRMTLEEVGFNLHTLLEEVTDLFRYQAEQKDLQLITDIDVRTPAHIVGDPARLQQILTNLLSNSLKFTDQGSITLKIVPVSLPDDDPRFYIKFSVIDTGIGIPAEKHDLIFESFRQADDSVTRKYGGTGLGLAICKHLVEMMAGSIAFASEYEKGATFTFTARFTLDTIKHDARDKAPDISAFAEPLRPLTVLLADDNPLNRELLELSLSREGHTVLSAVDGLQVIELLREHSPDIVLMDIQMPKLDGISAVRRIRNAEAENTPKNLPVIAVTAHAMKDEKDRILAAGFDDYAAKPIDMEKLLHSIHRLVLGEKDPPKTPHPEAETLRTDSGRTRALRLLRNNVALFRRLEEIFMRDAPKELDSIREYLEQGDFQQATRLAHGLKGTSATIGADGIQQIAKETEQACREQDKAKALENLERLKHDIQRFINSLSQEGINAAE